MRKNLLILTLGVALSSAALAQSSPTGLWRTIDDDGKTEKSWVRITEANGVWSGRIEKIVDPAKAQAVCEACSDDRKGKPLQGLTILREVRAADGGVWEGGEILDPNNGKSYKVRMKPVDDGKKMEVRGYIGLPLLGRTQTWLRAE